VSASPPGATGPSPPASPGAPRAALPILVGAALMVSLAMGLRQSLGLFMPPITRDIGVTVAQFTFAVAVQNLAWGVLQPFAGALAVRVGFRPIMTAGALLYVAGMLALATAQGVAGVVVGAGVLIGASMACNGTAMALAVASRSVTPARRSLVLGIVSAAGSLGTMFAAPLGQVLSSHVGWRGGVLGFALLAAAMLPAAWIAGRTDATALPPRPPGAGAEAAGPGQALAQALRHAPFVVMALAYFVCGMQLIFLTTHLPAYLDLCGMDPMLGAQALGVIGAFNVLGSLFFGWAGGRWNKLVLLGGIYASRSVVLAVYFVQPPTPGGTLLFAAVMGFLWLGVGPLVAGAVAEMFGLRWQAMIQGLAFVSHQLGSFAGAFGGGWLFDALGSYELAWRIGVGLGLAAGAVQIATALARPPGGPRARAGVPRIATAPRGD